MKHTLSPVAVWQALQSWNLSSQNFVSAIMNIQLRFGLCHTIVLDKDSKFFGAFKEACNLLQLNQHVLSGSNHNPMMVKQVNRYLNKGLKVMSNNCSSIQIAIEAILLLLYMWNSAPIPGTDLSRCFVALGWEFQLPINFSANKYWELTSTPATIKSFARELGIHLQSSREIAKILVKEQRAWQGEFINAHCPDPKIYSFGDIVFVPRAVHSDASWGRVDKLTYAFTGPWQIVAKLQGTSYKIEHCSTKKMEKRHASDLSPYPPKLFLSNRLMVRTFSMDKSINRCPKVHTSKQGSKVLNHQHHLRSQHNSSPQINPLTSAGPPWPSSTRTSFRIHGHWARNLMQISLATRRLSHKASIQVHHPQHQSTQPQRFPLPMFWLSKSLLV